MTDKIRVTGKEIDFKSMAIGFLLAAVIFLGIGAYSGSGTQDVRIVGVSTYDRLAVKVERVEISSPVPVKLEKIDSGTIVPVSVQDVRYSLSIPVKIENQPVAVTQR